MNEIIQEGKTQEEALVAALAKLGAGRDDVEVEVLTTSREGLFGFLGSRNVRIRVTVKDSAAPAAVEEEEYDDEEQPPMPALASSRADYDGDTPEDQVREFIEKVLTCLDVNCLVEVNEGENEIFVDIGGEDSGVIIGKFGQTLDSLQYLTNVIVGKKHGNKKKIVIDVGDYRTRREMSVKKLARSVARKVVKSRQSESLSPMSPQDRRTVHLALSDFRGIETISEGAGPNRKVVISYKK